MNGMDSTTGAAPRRESGDVIEHEIKRIVAEIIEVDVDALDCDAHFQEELGVDSLLGLEILAAIEQRFGIEVPEEELPNFTTVKKVIAVARERLAS